MTGPVSQHRLRLRDEFPRSATDEMLSCDERLRDLGVDVQATSEVDVLADHRGGAT